MEKILKYMNYLGRYLHAQTTIKRAVSTESVYVQYDDFVKIRLSDHLPVTKDSDMTICSTNIEGLYMVLVTESRKVLTFNYEGLKNFLRNTTLFIKAQNVTVTTPTKAIPEEPKVTEDEPLNIQVGESPEYVCGVKFSSLNEQEKMSIRRIVKEVAKKPNAKCCSVETNMTVLGYHLSLLTRGQKIYVDSTVKHHRPNK